MRIYPHSSSQISSVLEGTAVGSRSGRCERRCSGVGWRAESAAGAGVRGRLNGLQMGEVRRAWQRCVDAHARVRMQSARGMPKRSDGASSPGHGTLEIAYSRVLRAVSAGGAEQTNHTAPTTIVPWQGGGARATPLPAAPVPAAAFCIRLCQGPRRAQGEKLTIFGGTFLRNAEAAAHPPCCMRVRTGAALVPLQCCSAAQQPRVARKALGQPHKHERGSMQYMCHTRGWACIAPLTPLPPRGQLCG